jgi:hypothetical protein
MSPIRAQKTVWTELGHRRVENSTLATKFAPAATPWPLGLTGFPVPWRICLGASGRASRDEPHRKNDSHPTLATEHPHYRRRVA